jgi:hypothetical protein
LFFATDIPFRRLRGTISTNPTEGVVVTEPQWLKADDGDAMLAIVRDRLTPRKWALLACGVARRVWDLLPDDPYRDAIRLREDQANGLLTPTYLTLWVQRLTEGTDAVVSAATNRQREIVACCDPDAEGDGFEDTAARRINPAVPLYRAASRTATDALETTAWAGRYAASAVAALFASPPENALGQVRRAVIESLTNQATAGSLAALALEYKAKADVLADLGQVRNPRIRQVEADETVRRMSDNSAQRLGHIGDQKVRAENKAFGKLLLEQLGNPFRPYRFEPQWRTEHVVGLARAIDEDRAFERYPILLDALLDADCDEEAVLRHVRGTEFFNPNNAQHAVGCWVIDLILQKDEPLYALPPLPPGKAAPEPDPIAEPPFRDYDEDDENLYDGDME